MLHSQFISSYLTRMFENIPQQKSSLLQLNTSPFTPLTEVVEGFLGDKLQIEATSTLVEDYIKNQVTRPELVTAAHELRNMLREQGFHAALQYCKSTEHGHPIPVVVAQTLGGQYVLPNINSVWNPAPPLERGTFSADSQKKHVIAPDGPAEDNNPQLAGLRFEHFSQDSPVCLALLPSSSVDRPADAVPIFTDKAFDEALRHAAASIISECNDDFSVILEETIIPNVRSRIREQSALLGEREVPEIQNIGSQSDGSQFHIRTFVPLRDETRPLELQFSIDRSTGKVVCVAQETVA